jgi:predicted DNA-binding transcriptional regulator AlpA
MLSPKLYREQTHSETDMPSTQAATDHRFSEYASAQPTAFSDPDPLKRKPPQRVGAGTPLLGEPLLTVEDVARRLNVSKDWVWDHSSRKKPLLPVIRMGDGALRYRRSGIEAFIDERERLSSTGRRAS